MQAHDVILLDVQIVSKTLQLTPAMWAHVVSSP